MSNNKQASLEVSKAIGVGIFNMMLKQNMISEHEHENMTKGFINQLERSFKASK